MGRELHEQSETARDIFARADAKLGRSLSSICFDGPDEELTRSANTQPALLVVSAILFEHVREAGVTCEAVAGHSLGEYSALYAAGTLDLETAIDLVGKRGAAMSAACEARPGKMAALIGATPEGAAALVASVEGVAVVANDNCPGQIVISGEAAAIDAAIANAKAHGAKLAKALPVQGAYHSPLMEPARDTMRAPLAEATIAAPTLRFIANVSAEYTSDPETIRAGLVDQITASVRWRESIERLAADGFDTFVEIGWGSVLAGMFKRWGIEAKAISVESLADVATLADKIAG
jgi:[acyl-carrier-protein] S-malonyltransferase